MKPLVGQRWKYQSASKKDSFICEVVSENKYLIVQYIDGSWHAGLSYPFPKEMVENHWEYLIGQDKPTE